MSITLQNYQSRIHGGSINLNQFSINKMSMFPCIISFKKECCLTIIYFSDFKVHFEKFSLKIIIARRWTSLLNLSLCHFVIEKVLSNLASAHGESPSNIYTYTPLKDFSPHASYPHHRPLEPSIYVFYWFSGASSIQACNVLVFVSLMLQNS
jgi:hypothetical protein